MKKPALKRVEELFNQALALSAEERTDFLDDACFGEPELRSAVEDLLRHDQEDDTTHEIRVGPVAAAAEELGADAPTMINPNPDVVPPEAQYLPQIPGYELLQELGRGGMGIVYKARQLGLNRIVALKVLLHGGLAGSESLARFRAEAQLLARLQHPNIVSIYDIGEYEEKPYFAMEFVSGPSLVQALSSRPQDVMAAASFMERVARAIHAVHECGIIHRDLKPANILLAGVRGQGSGVRQTGVRGQGSGVRGQSENATGYWLLATDYSPKITDFGIAKDETIKDRTRTGQTLGTPCYMAPEQARKGATVGPKADIYALGAILYEMLTGRPPLEADTPAETIALVLNEEPIPPWRLRPRLPRDLGTISLKCLEKSPARRYATTFDLAEDLRRFQEHEPIRARPIGIVERAYRWCRRKPQVAALVALLAATLVAFMATVVVYDFRLREVIGKQRHQIIELNINLGVRDEEVGDTFAAVLRYAQALKYDEMLAQDQEMNRRRIAVALRQCPTLIRLEMTDGPVLCTNFDEGGSLVVTADGPAIRVHDYLNKESTARNITVPEAPQKGSISKDGQYLAARYADGSASVWELRSGKSFALPLPGQQPIQDLSFHSAPAILVTHHAGSVVRLWSQTDKGPVRIEKIAIEPASFTVLSENGKWLCALDARGMAHVHSLGLEDTAPPAFNVNEQVRIGAISPDGTRLALLGNTGTGNIWETRTGTRLGKPMPLDHDVSRLLFSPDGERLFAGGASAAAVWNAGSGELLADLSPLPAAFTDAEFSNDGRLLLLTGPHGSRVWDSKSGQCVTPLLEHGRPHTAAFSSNGRGVIVADRAGMIQAWQVPIPADAGNETVSESDGDLTRTVSMGVPSLSDQTATSPDGAHAVTCENQRVARLSHKATGISWLLEHKAPLICGTFSPDGRYFVTASADRAIRVWDVTTGKPLSPPLRHAAAIKSVAFRKNDSTNALVYHENGKISTWSLSPDNQHTVQQFMELAQLLTASRIDEQENQQPLEIRELLSAWNSTERIRQELAVAEVRGQGSGVR